MKNKKKQEKKGKGIKRKTENEEIKTRKTCWIWDAVLLWKIDF